MTNAATYLALSHATLDKHARNGAFNTSAALRLLRRNARDIAPGAPYVEQARIARQLLTQWRDSRIKRVSTDSGMEHPQVKKLARFIADDCKFI